MLDLDENLVGVWKVLCQRMNGQPPRRAGALYVFGDLLVVHGYRKSVTYDYVVDSHASPCRFQMVHQQNGKHQNAIYQIEADNLKICETSKLFDAKEHGLQYPKALQTDVGDQYTLTELERVPVEPNTFETVHIPDFLLKHCGPAPGPSKEQLKRRRELRRSRSKSAEGRISELAIRVIEKYKDADCSQAIFQEMEGSERTGLAVFWLVSEVNNGGFHQYLFNGAGAFAKETSYILKKIGAFATANMLDTALALFPKSTPALAISERRSQLESFTLEQHEVLQQLDQSFYDRTEDTFAVAEAYLDSQENRK